MLRGKKFLLRLSKDLLLVKNNFCLVYLIKTALYFPRLFFLNLIFKNQNISLTTEIVLYSFKIIIS